ncbi:MAG: ferrochelatase [Parachlamydiales bacterium]|nr:ferrochelatase [Parachlamydiales bacterium]
MFENKKISYIFIYFKEKTVKNKQKINFFKKITNIFKNHSNKSIVKIKKDVIKNKLDEFTNYISKYTPHHCLSFCLDQKTDLYENFYNDIKKSKSEYFYIFPFYPQISIKTANLANHFSKIFSEEIMKKMLFVKSYHISPSFIKAHQKNIKKCLLENKLSEKETTLLFYAEKDDILLNKIECINTAKKIISIFPYLEGELIYSINDIKIKQRSNYILVFISSLIKNYEIQLTLQEIKNYLSKENKHVFITQEIFENLEFKRDILDIIDEKNFITNEMMRFF